MKVKANPIHKRCGAKCRTRGYQPCRTYAVKGSNRCRMHGGKSTGPRTAAGKKKISEASIKTGLHTNVILEIKKRCNELKSDARDVMESVLHKIDLRTRMEAGDAGALCELTKEVFGEDPRDCISEV